MTTPTGPGYVFSWKRGVAGLDKQEWDELAQPLETPFLEWDWLRMVEAESATPETGWHPFHLTVRKQDVLVAAAPLYVKPHSEGEFVFDYMWADVAERIGTRYYPKMVGMSPFSPVPGYRFLLAAHEDEAVLGAHMIRAIQQVCVENGLAGCSFLFTDPTWTLPHKHGYHTWEHPGYAWENHSYADFNAFLARFKTGRRRNVKRERAELANKGIRVRVFEGEDIPREYFPIMYALYANTNDKFGRWSCKYLERSFFGQLHEAFRHRLVFVVAFRQGSDAPIGMSFLVVKDGRLYGRYWGAFEHVPFLHFELCYYKPIEWAIQNKIHSFDPGMGGEHKIRRGFLTNSTYSLHSFFNPQMDAIFVQHIDEVNKLERVQMDMMNVHLPFSSRDSLDE